MKNLSKALNKALQNCKFVSSVNGQVKPATNFQNLHYSKSITSFNLAEYQDLMSSEILDTGNFFSALIKEIREIVEQSSDTSKLAIRGFWPKYGEHEFEVTDFSKKLLKSSILVGQELIEDYLNKWISGHSLSYLDCGKINVQIDNTKLEIPEGVQIISTSNSPKNLAERFIDSFQRTINDKEISELPTITLNKQLKPFLYNIDDTITPPEIVLANSESEFEINQYCEVLSLVCNEFVMPITTWLQSEKLFPFLYSTLSEISWERKNHDESDRPTIIVKNLKDAVNLQVSREKLANKSLNRAIEWWVSSKKPTLDLKERCVFLRAALELTFLFNSEEAFDISFRLANNCAWYLGNGPTDRGKITKMIGRFYSIASQLIHGRDLSDKNFQSLKQLSEENLLDFAQQKCRDGIMKILELERKPVWKEYFLQQSCG